jgi:hypothetical protein
MKVMRKSTPAASEIFLSELTSTLSSGAPVSTRDYANSETSAADAGFAGVGHRRSPIVPEPREVFMAAERPDFERKWS